MIIRPCDICEDPAAAALAFGAACRALGVHGNCTTLKTMWVVFFTIPENEQDYREFIELCQHYLGDSKHGRNDCEDRSGRRVV